MSFSCLLLWRSLPDICDCKDIIAGYNGVIESIILICVIECWANLAYQSGTVFGLYRKSLIDAFSLAKATISFKI